MLNRVVALLLLEFSGRFHQPYAQNLWITLKKTYRFAAELPLSAKQTYRFVAEKHVGLVQTSFWGQLSTSQTYRFIAVLAFCAVPNI